MFDKTKIFNLALAALHLQKRISNADTDVSTETLTLQTLWDSAFLSALQEMDLDSTSTSKPLELVNENPNQFWKYAYKYPSDCVFLRRIVSPLLVDSPESKVDLRIELLGGQKVILTNEQFAKVEYISKDIPLETLHAEAIYFIALALASISVPLIVGTNSKQVQESVDKQYIKALVNAQSKDRTESTIYQPEWISSEFAKARLS